MPAEEPRPWSGLVSVLAQLALGNKVNPLARSHPPGLRWLPGHGPERRPQQVCSACIGRRAHTCTHSHTRTLTATLH